MAQVLLLDDDEINLLIYRKSLAPVYDELVLFQTKRELMDHLAKKPTVAFALLDIVLGDNMDGGLEVLQDLREKGHQFPAVALTSFSSATDQKRFLRSGFDDFISKPMEKDHFMQLLDKYVNGNS